MEGVVGLGAVTDRRGSLRCLPLNRLTRWASWRCPKAFFSWVSCAAMVVLLALARALISCLPNFSHSWLEVFFSFL
jgi:hypothetical protein